MKRILKREYAAEFKEQAHFRRIAAKLERESNLAAGTTRRRRETSDSRTDGTFVVQ